MSSVDTNSAMGKFVANVLMFVIMACVVVILAALTAKVVLWLLG